MLSDFEAQRRHTEYVRSGNYAIAFVLVVPILGAKWEARGVVLDIGRCWNGDVQRWFVDKATQVFWKRIEMPFPASLFVGVTGVNVKCCRCPASNLGASVVRGQGNSVKDSEVKRVGIGYTDLIATFFVVCHVAQA